MTDTDNAIPEDVRQIADDTASEFFRVGTNHPFTLLTLRRVAEQAILVDRAARPSPQGVVSVKRLEWGEQRRVTDEPWGDANLRQRIGLRNLGPVSGSYSVQEMSPGGQWGWWDGWSATTMPNGVEPTEEAAIARCEEDNRARIIAALSLAPQPAPSAERGAEVTAIEVEDMLSQTMIPAFWDDKLFSTAFDLDKLARLVATTPPDRDPIRAEAFEALAASCREFLPILDRQLVGINPGGIAESSTAYQTAKARVDRMRSALALSTSPAPQADEGTKL